MATGILGQVTYTLNAAQPAMHRALPSQHNNTAGFSKRRVQEVWQNERKTVLTA